MGSQMSPRGDLSPLADPALNGLRWVFDRARVWRHLVLKTSENYINCRADPLVGVPSGPGPPGPALRSKNQPLAGCSSTETTFPNWPCRIIGRSSAKDGAALTN